jgi:hypothetical protein
MKGTYKMENYYGIRRTSFTQKAISLSIKLETGAGAKSGER